MTARILRFGRRTAVASGATLTLAGALMVAPGVVGVANAAPEDPTDFSVTVAARYCPDYSSVQANIARNGFQETFEDLGAASSYPGAFPVNPGTEDANQADCTAMDGWRFTLGTGTSGGMSSRRARSRKTKLRPASPWRRSKRMVPPLRM